jgi:Zn-dependent protease with chaperone function
MYVLLVFGYVFLTIMIVIFLLMVFGVRMADWVRWVILVGWFVICFGGVWVVERLSGIFWPDWRRPIRAEEERLVSLMSEVRGRAGSKMRVRLLISGEAEKPTGSFGYRTVVVQSGSLPLASDGELRGILAHELGHLRDGDRVMEAAFVTAGLLARLFRWGCWLIGWGFRFSIIVGLFLMAVLFLLLIGLLPFFLLDGVFRVLRWGLRWQIDYRQDAFAFRVGCGDGLRAWLVRSGLAAHVRRIRRLEKME